MIALYIIAALLLLVCLLLFWPVSTVIDFDSTDKALGLYIRLLGIKIPITGKDKKQKKDKPKEKKPEKEKEKKENFLVTQLKEKFKHDGTANALRDLTGAAKNILSRVRWMLSKIAVRDFTLNIEVATDDAAKTAIEYGAVCGVVYPFLELLTATADFKAKKVDIRSAFGKTESSIAFHIKLKIQIITLFITAWEIYKEYKNFTEEKQNERK